MPTYRRIGHQDYNGSPQKIYIYMFELSNGNNQDLASLLASYN